MDIGQHKGKIILGGVLGRKGRLSEEDRVGAEEGQDSGRATGAVEDPGGCLFFFSNIFIGV